MVLIEYNLLKIVAATGYRYSMVLIDLLCGAWVVCLLLE